jgi:hypothetical protein
VLFLTTKNKKMDKQEIMIRTVFIIAEGVGLVTLDNSEKTMEEFRKWCGGNVEDWCNTFVSNSVGDVYSVRDILTM